MAPQCGAAPRIIIIIPNEFFSSKKHSIIRRETPLQLLPASIFKATIRKLKTLTSARRSRRRPPALYPARSCQILPDLYAQDCPGTKDDKVKRKEKSPLEKSMNTWVWHKDQIKWMNSGQNYPFYPILSFICIHHNQKWNCNGLNIAQTLASKPHFSLQLHWQNRIVFQTNDTHISVTKSHKKRQSVLTLNKPTQWKQYPLIEPTRVLFIQGLHYWSLLTRDLAPETCTKLWINQSFFAAKALWGSQERSRPTLWRLRSLHTSATEVRHCIWPFTGYCSVVKFSHKCSCIKQQCSGSCNLTHVCFYVWSSQKYDAKHGETLPKSKLLHEQKLKPFRILQVLHAEVCLVHGLHPAFKNLGNLNQKDGGFSSRGATFGKLM